MTEKNITETTKTEIKKVAKPKVLKLSDSTSIKVKSGFYGTLVYKNARSGEIFKWNGVGDIQFMTLSELKTMKAQSVGFFKNQWILIAGVAEDSDSNATVADIYKALAVEHYYKNFIDPTSFNSIIALSESEIKEKLTSLSETAKSNLTVALCNFIKDGTLDSIRKIRAFEEVLGCSLMDEGY